MFRDRNSFRVRWTVDGKTQSKSFPRDQYTKEDVAIFEAQVKSGTFVVKSKETELMTFAKWAERWFDVYAKVEKSETTWATDKAELRNHINPVIGHLKLTEIRKSHGLDLKAVCIAKGLREKSVNNILHLAKKILLVAVDYELISSSPWQEIKSLKVPKPNFRFWTKADSEKFLKRCKELRPEFAEFVQVAIHTGLRWGELRALRRQDIDLHNGIITVCRTYNAKLKKVLERTKNKDIGRVEMSVESFSIMKTKALMKPDQLVFDPEMVNNAWRYLGIMCEKANVQKIGVHDLRHTCASQLAMAGVPLYKISRHLRHKDTKTTERYAHLSAESLSGITTAFSSQHSVREQQETTKKVPVSL